MNWEDFVSNVQRWARERGIYEHSTPEAQLLKALSELGELADAVVKNDRDALKDAIGDVAVCAINYAKLAGLPTCGAPVDYIKGDSSILRIGEICVIIGRILRGDVVHDSARCLLDVVVGICRREGLDFIDCCAAAWLEIKDRKGHMVAGGVFVKEEASVEQRLAEPKAEMAKLEEQLEAIGAVGVTLTHVQQLMNRKE